MSKKVRCLCRDHYEQVTRPEAEAAIELSGGLDQSKTLVGKPDLLQALELDDIVVHPEEKFFEIGTGILASVPVASDSYAPASLFVSVTREASLDLKRVLVFKKSRSFRCKPYLLEQAMALEMG